MFYKQIIISILILLVACTEQEQAGIANEKAASSSLDDGPSMEEARKIAEAAEKEYYSDQPKPIRDSVSKRREKKLDAQHFSLAGFPMMETSFETIKSSFGETDSLPDPNPGAEGHPEVKEICYISENENDTTLVVIGAGFYSGYEDFNSATIFANKEDFEGRDHCVRSSLVNREISTQSGIHLGMDANKMLAMLDNDAEFDGYELTYKGGYVAEGENGREFYYYQDIAARSDEQGMLNYIKISLEAELW